jgi:hypothetical protein
VCSGLPQIWQVGREEAASVEKLEPRPLLLKDPGPRL